MNNIHHHNQDHSPDYGNNVSNQWWTCNNLIDHAYDESIISFEEVTDILNIITTM